MCIRDRTSFHKKGYALKSLVNCPEDMSKLIQRIKFTNEIINSYLAFGNGLMQAVCEKKSEYGIRLFDDIPMDIPKTATEKKRRTTKKRNELKTTAQRKEELLADTGHGSMSDLLAEMNRIKQERGEKNE